MFQGQISLRCCLRGGVLVLTACIVVTPLRARAQQQPLPSPTHPVSAAMTRKPRKLPPGTRGFEQFAGCDASDKLLMGAATRSPNSRGLLAYEEGRLEDAARLFAAHALAEPRSPKVHFDLATVYAELGREEEAVPEFKRALALADSDPWLRLLILYNLANADYDLGEYEQAISTYRQLVGLKPALAQPHYNLGLAYAAMGRQVEAVTEFKEAARLQPDYAEAHYNLGVAYAQGGDKNQAAEQLQHLRKLHPELAAKLALLLAQ